MADLFIAASPNRTSRRDARHRIAAAGDQEPLMDPDRFKADRWWNVVAGAGGLIAVAALWQQFIAAFPIGLGLLSFGVGEWINHPPRTEIARSMVVNTHADQKQLLEANGLGRDF